VEAAMTVVRTRAGRVRGTTSHGVHVFKGIPYAKPPFGARRFRPPQPVDPWDGVREATAFGPTAPQPEFPGTEGFYPVIKGEDCLNLNVWTRDPGAAGLPVMVWLHGGGTEGGSPLLYDGTAFARDGVVFVSVSYRLGIEGLLHLGDGPANLTLLDQIAALEWVRDNIAAFGGDPDNVTVFGESSGAMFTGALLVMPRARGLFRRAIMQSGAGSIAFTPETARHVGGVLAEILGVEPTLEAIAAVPVERALAAHHEVMAALAPYPDPRRWNGEPGARVTAWQPVIDGDTLPGRPVDLIGPGVDIMVGSNAEEGRLSLVPFVPLSSITEETLVTAMKLYGLPVEEALAVYRDTYPGAGPGDLLALLQRDWWYRAPGYRVAEAAGAHVYEFAWRSPQFGGLLGACHFLEVPFVFDLLGRPPFDQLTGPEPPQELARAMHAAWVAFATHGDPGWPAYDLTLRPVMRFGEACEVVLDPEPALRELWRGIC